MQTVLRICIFGVILWFGGFIWFVTSLPRQGDLGIASEIGNLSREDTGIVALTGGGGSRIKAAIMLLDTQAGAKILISGVHPETKKQELAARIDGATDLFECCVDLGQRAQTTKGNAVEARDWVQGHDYGHIILVTTDYHVPRAVLEIRALLPEVEIIAYPVASKTAPESGWFTQIHAWRILITEYMKFIAVKAGQLLPVN